MTVMGINFTRMLVEKRLASKGKLSISNNVAITGVEKINLNFPTKDQESLKFKFEFKSKYTPDIGTIDLEGEVIYLEQKKKADEILKKWDKDKTIEAELKAGILGAVLNKCHIQALVMSKEIGLPAPIPLPKVQMKK